jgi:segregation and condensation protein B
MSETEAPAAADAAAEAGATAEPLRRETRAERLVSPLEAVLFTSPKPVRERDLAELLEAAPKALADALQLLAARYEGDERGVRVERVAGGWRFVTRPEFDALLRKFHEVTERSRLSLAALETLAIIAYRQPITLPEIQDIRGVNSSSVLKTLFEKKLITTAGKKPVVGTPFFYRTTQEFLVRFGLNELTELPRPEDLDSDLAATVEAREIAAPTATLSGIHVEPGVFPDPDADGAETGASARSEDRAGSLPEPARAVPPRSAPVEDDDEDARDEDADEDEDEDDEEFDEDELDDEDDDDEDGDLDEEE